MKANQAGFTLVELMISMVILSMLLFTASYSYRILSDKWDTVLSDFDSVAAENKGLGIFFSVIKGVYPSVLFDTAFNPRRPVYLFVGFKDSLLSTTSSGVFLTSEPEVFRVSVVKNAQGKADLIYQKSSNTSLIITAKQVIEFKEKITLLRGMDSIEFKYFGWSSIEDKSSSVERKTKATWRSNYSGMDSQLLPEKILIQMKKGKDNLELYVELDSNSFRNISAHLEE